MRAPPADKPDYLLQGGVATLILVATIALGIGEQSIVLTLVTIAALAVSNYVTDLKRSFQLSQPVANYIALGIVAVSAINVVYVDRSRQVGIVASLQSYLQYVLLFQPKTSRVYWQLAVLSLGQIAIAATLVPGPLFGSLLFLYLLAGVVTFTLLLLRSEASRFAASHALATASAGSLRTPAAIGRAPVLDGGIAPVAGNHRRGLFEQVAAMACVTIVVGAALFFFIPRRTLESRETPTNEPLRAIGFSKTITLGELGDVVQNPDLVMRVQFFHGRSMRPFKLADEPLLRGSVVTRYRNNAWTQPRAGNTSAFVTDASPVVRQRITIEPLDVDELFCVVPVLPLHPDSRLRVNANGEHLSRKEEDRAQQIEFEVGTTGIANDRMRKFLPCKSPMATSTHAHLLEPFGDETRSARFQGLRETAAEVLREKNVAPSDRLGAILALYGYLRFSGNYSYSLEAQPRDPELDPLEDFVTVHRAGHCEYFAGALTLMLRSQGIPARMAIGFKGGEWNPLGMYYQVQQLHAHTWVEAYLSEEEIPADEFEDEGGTPPGAWLVLDPTVGVYDANDANQRSSLMARLRQSIDYAQVLWANYILGLNSRRQQQGIYEPLEAGVRAGFQNLFGREVWRERLRAVGNSPVGSFWEWYRRHWFSWRGGLVAAGVSLFLVCSFFAARWLVVTLKRLLDTARGRGTRDGPTLEMYRRLESVLARHGFQRQPAQTAHEFAVVVGGYLAESIELNRISHLPRRIVESFYRVRFGGRTLDNREAQAVEHALVELESTLGRRR